MWEGEVHRRMFEQLYLLNKVVQLSKNTLSSQL